MGTESFDSSAHSDPMDTPEMKQEQTQELSYMPMPPEQVEQKSADIHDRAEQRMAAEQADRETVENPALADIERQMEEVRLPAAEVQTVRQESADSAAVATVQAEVRPAEPVATGEAPQAKPNANGMDRVKQAAESMLQGQDPSTMSNQQYEKLAARVMMTTGASVEVRDGAFQVTAPQGQLERVMTMVAGLVQYVGILFKGPTLPSMKDKIKPPTPEEAKSNADIEEEVKGGNLENIGNLTTLTPELAAKIVEQANNGGYSSLSFYRIDSLDATTARILATANVTLDLNPKYVDAEGIRALATAKNMYLHLPDQELPSDVLQAVTELNPNATVYINADNLTESGLRTLSASPCRLYISAAQLTPEFASVLAEREGSTQLNVNGELPPDIGAILQKARGRVAIAGRTTKYGPDR